MNSITLGPDPGVTRTTWPSAGAGQGVSTWADLSDTPQNYGAVDQLIVSLGPGTGNRFRYAGIAALLPDAVTFSTSVTTPRIILNGEGRNTWPTAGVNNFVDLHDVGITALAQAQSRVLRVNSQGTSIEAAQLSFLDLFGTPSAYGTAGQSVIVNAGADGLTFGAATAGGGRKRLRFGFSRLTNGWRRVHS